MRRRRLAPGAGDVDGDAPAEGCGGMSPPGGEVLHAVRKQLVLSRGDVPVTTVHSTQLYVMACDGAERNGGTKCQSLVFGVCYLRL